jgi:SAM-dependent methyltransferase
MSHAACTQFVARNLTDEVVSGENLRVLEVGSYDPDGGFRALTEQHGGFAEYVGVDLREGPGIDFVCEAEHLVERFGESSFDLVIAVELLEHVRDWREAVSNLKKVCKPDGAIIVTTRSRGYPYHAAPYDFWRFETEDFKNIFSDCHQVLLEKDWESPGVFAAVRKPRDFRENDLAAYCLYCIITNRRQRDVNFDEMSEARILLLVAAAKLRQVVSWLLTGSKKDLRITARGQFNELCNLLAMLRRSNRPLKM